MVTYINKNTRAKYAGDVLDNAPKNVQNGSVYFAMAEGKYYMYDAENDIWHEQMDNGSGGGGEGGTTDHSKLTNRSKPNQHPIGAITGLQGALDEKQPVGNYVSDDKLTQELGKKQDVGDYATKTELTDATKDKATKIELTEGLEGKQPKGDYALKSDVPKTAVLYTPMLPPLTPEQQEQARKNIGADGGSGGTPFGLPLLYEITTDREVRWIDTGDKAFEAKSIMVIEMIVKDSPSMEKNYGGACSVYPGPPNNPPEAPFSNYELAFEIEGLLPKQHGAIWNCVAFRGNPDGHWNSIWKNTNAENVGQRPATYSWRNFIYAGAPCTGIIVGDRSAQIGSRTLGAGTTLKIWGC